MKSRKFAVVTRIEKSLETVKRSSVLHVPFNAGVYQEVYRYVTRLRVYQDALKQHLSWLAKYAEKTRKPSLDFADFAGGQGFMTRQVMQSFPHVQARLLDLSREMLAQAEANGIPPEALVEADLEEMRGVSNESFDFGILHSALWMAENPLRMLCEVASKLRLGGQLSVVTLRPFTSQEINDFVSDLDSDLSIAGVSEADRKIFLQSQRDLLAAVRSHQLFTAEQLISLARYAGLSALDVRDAYVVQGQSDRRTVLMTQILFEKANNREQRLESIQTRKMRPFISGNLESRWNARIQIIQAKRPDENGIRKVISEVREEAGITNVDEPCDSDLCKIEEIYDGKNGVFYLLANEKGEVLGTGGITRLTEKSCELRKFYIRQPLRGQGYGKALLAKLLHDAHSFGYETIELETLSHLQAANTLYRQMGFSRAKTKRKQKVYVDVALSCLLNKRTLERSTRAARGFRQAKERHPCR